MPPPKSLLSLRLTTCTQVLPMSLLSFMTLLSFKVPAKHVADRASITLTLLLTAVAYKQVTDSMLPAISYLTLIDKFIAACVFQIGAVVGESALAEDRSDLFDWYGLLVCLLVWALTHAYFGVSAALMLRRRHVEWATRVELLEHRTIRRETAYARVLVRQLTDRVGGRRNTTNGRDTAGGEGLISSIFTGRRSSKGGGESRQTRRTSRRSSRNPQVAPKVAAGAAVPPS